QEPTLRWECDWKSGEMNVVTGIWGISLSNIYFIGNTGYILHYDGSSFIKRESGTDVGIIDIWGLDGEHVWVVTYTNNPTIKNEVLFYNGSSWSMIYERTTENWPPEDYSLPSGSFLSTWGYGDTVYLGCASLWKESVTTGEGRLTPLEEVHWELDLGIAHVRGDGPNNIFVTTSFGSEVSHFNGKNWKFFDELKIMDPQGRVSTDGLAVKGDIVVLVGEDYSTGKAIVYRGYR
ncbi:MAG: hypothetical protein ACE5EE_06850, partial [Fidelibacterota bacterium]